MQYINGAEVLPEELVKEIQKYIDGEIIYIPKAKERTSWGCKSGTRDLIDSRNKEIFLLYNEGNNIKVLAERFFLSECSIKKIINKYNK